MATLKKRETLVPLALSFIDGPHFAKILTAGQVREIKMRCRRDPETNEVIDVTTFVDALCETVLVDEAGKPILGNNDAARLPDADHRELADAIETACGYAKKKTTANTNGSPNTNGSHAGSHSTAVAEQSETQSPSLTECPSPCASSG